MLAEQSHFDLSQVADQVDGAKLYEQLVQTSLTEVVTLFEPEHQAEAQRYLESCFTVTILQAIEPLPTEVQTEFLERLTGTTQVADGLPPVDWLLMTVKDTHPTFGEDLKRVLIETKNAIVAAIAETESGV